jgi:hypothetical protein
MNFSETYLKGLKAQIFPSKFKIRFELKNAELWVFILFLKLFAFKSYCTGAII